MDSLQWIGWDGSAIGNGRLAMDWMGQLGNERLGVADGWQWMAMDGSDWRARDGMGSAMDGSASRDGLDGLRWDGSAIGRARQWTARNGLDGSRWNGSAMDGSASRMDGNGWLGVV